MSAPTTQSPPARQHGRTTRRVAFAGIAALALVSTPSMAMAATGSPHVQPRAIRTLAARPGNPAPSYNGLALTPPMGWNDWSYYQCNISEKLILQQAKALVDKGLAKAGYNTVTIDDCWMAKTRDAKGNLQANPTTFPHGIKYIADKVHAMGLKFGIYEDSGTATCGGYPGSWGHYTQDAKQFAAWGVDYVKLDGCNVPSVAGETSAQTYNRIYDEFSAALRATGRPMVFSDSAPAYFQGTSDWYDVIANSAKIANLWREGADTALGQQTGAEKWNAIAYNYGYNVGLGRYAGPGHWNDPDFLLTGDSGLSTTEMQSQLTLWAEMAAPLISSTDLTALSPAATKILTNRAIIAVDQDKLGVQGSIVQTGSNYDVLAKPLAGGDVAVVLFNKGNAAQKISTTADNVGVGGSGPYRMTDLVTGSKTLSSGIIAADVPAHGTVIYRVHPNAAGAALPSAASLGVTAGKVMATKPARVTVTVANDGPRAISTATVHLTVPKGWKVQPRTQTLGRIRPGQSAPVVFTVTGSKPSPGPNDDLLTATADYTSDGKQATTRGYFDVLRNVPYANLAAAYNNVGVTAGADPTPGNFDGSGNSFNAELLAGQGLTPGANVTANGFSFTWPNVAPGVADNAEAAGQLIKLTGTGSTLAFLGSGVGDQSDTVTVHYTDGSTSTGTVGFPNWSFSDPTEFGAKLAFSTMGRNTPTGLADTAYAYRIFTNTIPLDTGKTVQSVQLPNNSALHLFAWTVG
ncbi:NEW3 domain-containing protein [Flexivirga caeni]|uniref:Alpha-galactosidase n=1 Tax=Flexivirga caeni TaxID=2294115 RepID=A0A3M9MI77_9MICO|nr:NEW3 domain-containing protein [Flexivirga caeni]RNI24905.1 hypothetical protein EFY87_04280 [Flexivirga caeni]